MPTVIFFGRSVRHMHKANGGIPTRTQARPKMPDYSKGKIYRILQDDVKTVYIGSTTQPLSARMATHRKDVKRKPTVKLFKLMGEVGVAHFKIELITDFPCERGEQLRAEEGRQIRLNNTIEEGANINVAGRKNQEYNRDNADAVAARKKAYNKANADAIAAHQKAYNEANADAIAANKKAYRVANRDAINARQKAMRTLNADAINAGCKAYRAANRDAINARRREASKAKRDAATVATPVV